MERRLQGFGALYDREKEGASAAGGSLVSRGNPTLVAKITSRDLAFQRNHRQRLKEAL